MTFLYKALSIILLVLSIFLVVNFEPEIVSEIEITGNVVNDAYGCCETTCTQTTGIECSGDLFHPEKECMDVSQCNVGCCIDEEQNCYGNYIKSLCDKEGDIFVGGRECEQFKECMIAPPAPARQTGFMYENNDGVLLVEKTPNSGKIGTPFVFEITTAQKEKFVQLEINASGQIFTKSAYDDGLGTDEKADDEKYTVGWIASINTDEKGIIPVSLQVLIDGKRRGNPYPLYISPTSCIPSVEKIFTNITKKNIIFAKNSILLPDTKNIGVMTMMQMVDSNFDFFFLYDLYHVENTMDSINEIEQECFFVDNPDLIVMVDKNEELCTQKGNYVTLNPNFGMNPKEERPENGSFIDDFCKYVTTQENEIQIAHRNIEGPGIKLIQPKNNDKIKTKETTISFTAYDNQSEILRYGIYQDSDYNKVGWGYMKSGSTITRKIKTQDGPHELYVNVEDTDRNIVGKGVNVTIDYSNFKVTTNLETDTTVNRYLSFSFKYSHDKFKNSTYHIFDGKRSVETGTALRDEENYVTLDLETGEHIIYVVLYDNEGRKASSYEYLINSRRQNINPITANAIFGIERFAPVTSKPFDNASEDGYKTKEKTDDKYNYKEVDEEGEFEPSLLCEVSLGGVEDTLVRYRPANCMNKTGSEIDIEPVSRDFINDQYFYEYSYFVKSCDDEIFFDAYLKDDFNNQEEIHSGVLDTGYGVDDRGSQSSSTNYTQVCLTVSEPDATIAGFFGPPTEFVQPEFNNTGKISETSTNTSNNDGFNYSTLAEFNPLESQYHTPVVINDELGTTVCIKFSLKQCGNGIDDDGDGVIDMKDPGCNSSFDDNEGDATTECQDGEDNDGDTQIDEDDIACLNRFGDYNKTHNNEASKDAQCSDKKDNDGDGMCDFTGCIVNGEERPADPGCEKGSDDRESAATSECQDGIDNDRNGYCDFEGCRISGRDLPPEYGCINKYDLFEKDIPPECLDGIDNDGNGWIDMEDFGCNSSLDNMEQLSGDICDSFDDTKFRGVFSYDLIDGTRSYTYDYELHACYWNLVYGIYLKQGEKTLELNTSTNGALLKNKFEKYKNVIYNDDIYTEFCVEVFTGDPQFGKQCFKLE